MNISIEKTTSLKQKPPHDILGFGNYFSDHMFLMDYTEAEGWHNARITPYQPIPLDPGASVLHYGQTVFEGLKAFKQKDGGVALFRPNFNFKRMRDGASRLCMPAPSEEQMLEGIKKLIEVDRSWVPSENGCALYIRPTLIGTEGFLGVRPSKKYIWYVILSPVGAYYKEGLNPVKIWVEQHYTRAALGGLGSTKAGANYAASLLAAENAKKKGYAQVLWSDSKEHRYIEEVGTMNVFFVLKDKVVTPHLNGSILGGATRACAIKILKDWGMNVEERTIAIDEVVENHRLGKLREVFGTGTAAVISPVGELFYNGEPIIINDFKMGDLSQRLYDEITGIQRGEREDKHGWVIKV